MWPAQGAPTKACSYAGLMIAADRHTKRAPSSLPLRAWRAQAILHGAGQGRHQALSTGAPPRRPKAPRPRSGAGAATHGARARGFRRSRSAERPLNPGCARIGRADLPRGNGQRRRAGRCKPPGARLSVTGLGRPCPRLRAAAPAACERIAFEGKLATRIRLARAGSVTELPEVETIVREHGPSDSRVQSRRCG